MHAAVPGRLQATGDPVYVALRLRHAIPNVFMGKNGDKMDKMNLKMENFQKLSLMFF